VSDLLGEGAPALEPVIEHRLRAVAVVRGVLTLAVATFLATTGRALVEAPDAPLGVATVLVLLAFSLTVPFWPARSHRAVLDVALVVDAAGIGILLAITGGTASPFTPLAVLVAALPLLAFGARTGLRAAIATTVAIGWVWASSPDLVASNAAAEVPRAALVADTRVLVTLLATWSAVGAVALLQRVVERDLRRAAQDVGTLHRINRALDADAGPEGVAARLATAVVDHLDEVDSASVWLVDRTRAGLVLAGATGRGVRTLGETHEVAREGLIASALLADTVVTGPPVPPLDELHEDATDLVAVALRGDAAAPLGVLVVAVTAGRRFGRSPLDVRQVQALEELADDAGSAFDDAYAMEHLRTLARTDPVTGMPNHRVLQERLQIELGRLARRRGRGHGAALSLALFDLDHFKRVNDTHGHQTGDAVLAAVAEAVDRAARGADLVCRYGGEEFAVVLVDTDADEARAACERLRRVVASVRVPTADGVSVSVTASFGTATVTEPGPDRARLIDAADRAMYAAKAAGRNRVESGGVLVGTSA
jgi:diguanylate cyclase (GGDEF)-like protein